MNQTDRCFFKDIDVETDGNVASKSKLEMLELATVDSYPGVVSTFTKVYLSFDS